MNVNLSKSGFSLSSKNPLGTINLINPNRSSGKILGLQFRGSKGLAIAGIGALFSILFYLTSLFLRLVYFITLRLIPVVLWLIEITVNVIRVLSALLIYIVTDLPKQLMNKPKQ